MHNGAPHPFLKSCIRHCELSGIAISIESRNLYAMS